MIIIITRNIIRKIKIQKTNGATREAEMIGNGITGCAEVR